MTSKPKIANSDIIPYALFLLGGVGKFIDVEDVLYKCYELAPVKFKWRKYDIPNYKILTKAMETFEQKHPLYTLKTENGLGRQLTAEGTKWVQNMIPKYKFLLSSSETIIPSNRPNQKILNEMSTHHIFEAFISKGAETKINKFDAADFLLCSPDSPESVWKERIETYRSAAQASNREELVAFLKFMKKKNPEWFGEK